MMYGLATLNPKRRGTQTGSIPFCKRNVSYEVCRCGGYQGYQWKKMYLAMMYDLATLNPKRPWHEIGQHSVLRTQCIFMRCVDVAVTSEKNVTWGDVWSCNP